MPLSGHRLSSPLSGLLGTKSPALVAILHKYAWAMPIAGALGIIASVLEGIGIGLLTPLLAELVGHETEAKSGLLRGLTRFTELYPESWRVAGVAVTILTLILLKGAVQATNWTFIAWTYAQTGNDIRRALGERLLHRPYSFFLNQSPSRLINIIGTESWRATDAVGMAFKVFTAASAIFVYGTLLLFVSWQLTLVVACGVIAIRLGMLLITRHIERLGEVTAEANQGLSLRMLTIVDNMRLIRIFGQEPREHANYVRSSNKVGSALFRVERITSIIAPLTEVLLAGLFIIVALLAVRAHIALPMLVTFLVLVYRLQPQILMLNNARVQLAGMRGSVREVEWLLDSVTRDEDLVSGTGLPQPAAPIAFDHVDFCYPGSDRTEPVLRDVSFTLAPDRATALLGASGAGKTTIVNLLCRLIAPTAGTLRYGAEDAATISLSAWRGRIALAGQDIELLDGTVADNIAYGVETATREQIIEAAKLADAHRFIDELASGYDTAVGMGGFNLSGGQRQRLGIARALLCDPEVLILDEATSAVDGASEASILRVIARRAGRKMTIVISHRADTIAHCEDGIVLKAGRVIEAGPLKSLQFYQEMRLLSGHADNSQSLENIP